MQIKSVVYQLQQYPCYPPNSEYSSVFLFSLLHFFSASFFANHMSCLLINKGCSLARVHRHQDWLKTLTVGGWQDGWVGFQSWNLSDPAAVQVNYVGIRLELREGFCRRCTFLHIQNIFNSDTLQSAPLIEQQDQKHWNECVHRKLVVLFHCFVVRRLG